MHKIRVNSIKQCFMYADICAERAGKSVFRRQHWTNLALDWQAKAFEQIKQIKAKGGDGAIN